MRVILSGIVAALVLAGIAAFGLSVEQEPAYKVYSTSSARVSDPGTNLVGKNWMGNPGAPGQ